MALLETLSKSDPMPEKMEQPISKDGHHVTEEDYWAHYYNDPDFAYEWNNGYLEQKTVADFSKSAMYVWFLELLRHFLRVKPIADISTLDIGFRLTLPNGVSVRKPDLGVILKNNPTRFQLQDRSYHGIFDLCVESLSDSNRNEIERDTIVKRREYEQVGVQEYIILDDRPNRHIAFFQRAAAGIYIPIQPTSDGVIQSGALPGFQFRIQDLYDQPSPLLMSMDPIYQKFVWPEYQALDAENARLRAELARLREED